MLRIERAELGNEECEDYVVVETSVSIVDRGHVVVEGTLEECVQWRREEG